MADIYTSKSVSVFQLKECYDLAIRFAKSNTAKDILRKKSQGLDISCTFPVQADVFCRKTEMQIISEVVYEMSKEDLDSSEGSDFKYTDQMNSLPDSAEKEYVLALLSLKGKIGETQRRDALQHISSALRYSSEDPRYIALANILISGAN